MIIFFWILLFIGFPLGAISQTAELPTGAAPSLVSEKPSVQLNNRRTFQVSREPFVPETVDYVGELGAMQEMLNLYWIGGSIGFHVGKCLFSQSQSCQQYLDFTGGVGGRDSETNTLLMGSLRWQWVNFPSSWSPMARFFGGAQNAHESTGVRQFPIGGVGFGVSTFLHERADLRLETRLGYSEQPFLQVFFGIHIKMNRWVAYFGEKLKDLGIGTYETVKEAGEAVSKPFLPNKEPESSDKLPPSQPPKPESK